MAAAIRTEGIRTMLVTTRVKYLIALGAAAIVGAVMFPTIAHSNPVGDDWKSNTPAQSAFIMQLRNKHGEYCCANADGYRPNDQDIQWDMQADHYRVYGPDQAWHDIDDYMIPPDKNIIGRAVVWFYVGGSYDDQGGYHTKTLVRCFLPGPEL
jgi:hypothetical protein